MSKPARRLGRGLNSLISVPKQDETPVGKPAEPETANAEIASSVKTLRIDQLRPNPAQPRRLFSPEQLKALADSIAQTGIIQPIAVRSAGDGVYDIIVGERRWRAAQMAGLSEMPVVLREASDEQMLEVALVENIFREDLNAIDRATAYRRYCDEFKLSADQVAQRLGEDRTTVTNYLRLLDLPEQVKQWVSEEQLTMGHARCLLSLAGEALRIQFAQKVIDKSLSVRQLEQVVREYNEARSAPSAGEKRAKTEKRPLIRELEEAFVRTLGTKVDIQESKRKGKGKIVIHYKSLADFDTISERLGIETEGL